MGSTLVSQMGLSKANYLQPEQAPPASPRTKLSPEHWGVICTCGLGKIIFQSPGKERDTALIPGNIRKGVKMPVVNLAG